MLKYSDGTPIQIGDYVAFDYSSLNAKGVIKRIHPDSDCVDVKVDPAWESRCWPDHEFDRCWCVPLQYLLPLKHKALSPTQSDKQDIYSAGPEGETAGYIARGGGLKYL